METREEWMKIDIRPRNAGDFAKKIETLLRGKKVEFREWLGSKRKRKGTVVSVLTYKDTFLLQLTNRMEIEPDWFTVKYLGKRIFTELDPYGEENWEE